MSALSNFLLNQEDQFRRARIASLYSDFGRQRATNPDGFAANVSAWITSLSKAARIGLLPGCEDSILVLDVGAGLSQALETREWGQPAALGTVINEAVQKGDLVPLGLFLQGKTGSDNQSMADRTWSLLHGLMTQLGIAPVKARSLREGRYVMVGNVKNAAQKVAAFTQKRTNQVESIIPMSEFATGASKLLELQQDISQEDLLILLTYLAREAQVLLFNDRMVKLRGADGQLPAITARDQDIASVKSLINDLGKQSLGISARIQSLTSEIQAALLAKNRHAAKRYLRNRKTQEALLNRRTDTIMQLEELTQKLEEAANYAGILNALKSGTEALHGLNTELGGADAVELVLQGLSKEMATVEEIGSIVDSGAQISQTTDNDEIEAELEALEAASGKNDQKNQHAEEEAASSVEEVLKSLNAAPNLQNLPNPMANGEQDRGRHHTIDQLEPV